jgi:hypothetical protein
MQRSAGSRFVEGGAMGSDGVQKPNLWFRSAALAATGLVSLGVVGAAFAFDMPGAFAITFALLGLWFGVAAFRARRPALQNVNLVLASCVVGLAVAEVLFWFPNHSRPRVTGAEGAAYNLADPDLGYRPPSSTRVAARKTDRGKVIYDAVYTFGEDGLRVTPNPVAGAPCTAVFLGDSFTFGEGLNDDETMPATFVRASGGLYRGFNFGFSGYGPHQMLRALETGLVDAVVRGGVDLVLYQAIPDHPARAAGRANWDPWGPRYVLEKDGGLAYAGPFHGELHAMLTRSQIFRFFDQRLWAAARPAPADLPLFLAILERARGEVERRYRAPFILILWDVVGDGPPLADATMQALVDSQIIVLKISDVIPDIDARRPDYVLSPVDPHPNAAADRRIGEYLAHNVAPRYCGRAAVVNSPSPSAAPLQADFQQRWQHHDSSP